MVRPYDPGSVRFTFNAAHDPAHRFEPADMGFGKALAGVRIVPQMRVDRIAPVIGGRDLDYGAIDGTHAAAARSNLDDGVFRDRIDHLALADLGIVGAAIDAVDQKIDRKSTRLNSSH